MLVLQTKKVIGLVVLVEFAGLVQLRSEVLVKELYIDFLWRQEGEVGFGRKGVYIFIRNLDRMLPKFVKLLNCILIIAGVL